MTSNNKNCVKIIIIGAGISGLSTAYNLWNSGFNNLTLLEARDRIGGRIHSITKGLLCFVYPSVDFRLMNNKYFHC